MKKINVCAYARVSTDGKDQENSFENQKNYFQREIEKNEDYNLIEVYADKGLTATSTKRRKEFLRMVNDAGVDINMYAYTHLDRQRQEQIFTLSDRNPKFNKIFVKNTSRFARNIDVIDLLRKLRLKGVIVDFLDINKTTENEADFVFIEMLLVFDENDSRDKSRKVKFGQLEGMKNGVVHVNNRIYGYKKIDKYHLDVIQDEAEVIQFIFNEYANGSGIRVLIKQLKLKGYKTRQGKDFAKSTLLNIIKNEKYKGDNVRRKYTTGTIFVDKTNTSQVRNTDDWIVHENTIPSIVSDKLWNKCNELRESRNLNEKGVYRGLSKYAGLIKCGVCGGSYHKNVDRGRFFYNCSTKKQVGVDTCDNINVNESYIDESIQDLAEGGFYSDIIDDRDSYIIEMQRVNQIINNKLNEGINIENVEQLQNELLEVQNQKNMLSDLYLSGRVKIDYFDNKSISLDQIEKEVSEKIKFVYTDKDTILNELRDIDIIIIKLKNLDVKETYTDEEMVQEIESIKVERSFVDNKSIMLTFDYKILSEMNRLIDKYGEDFYVRNKSYYNEIDNNN